MHDPPTGQNQGKDMMSMLYEEWTESGGNWEKSKIYLQVSSKEKHQRFGVREWMTRGQLETKYGKDGADAIIQRKLGDKELKEKECKMHPDAPESETLMQFLVLNMEKEVDSTETAVNRLFEAAEGSDSSSSEESDEASSSSSSVVKKKAGKSSRKEKKGKKAKKEKEKKSGKTKA